MNEARADTAKQIFKKFDKIRIVNISDEGWITDVKFKGIDIEGFMQFNEIDRTMQKWDIHGYFIYFRDYLALKKEYNK